MRSYILVSREMMRRYSDTIVDDGRGNWHSEMKYDHNGYWVQYPDAARLEDEVERLRLEVDILRDRLSKVE
jgi:hypothetical protein